MPSAESSNGEGNIQEKLLRLLQTDYSGKPKPDMSAYLCPKPVTAGRKLDLDKPMIQQLNSGMPVNGMACCSQTLLKLPVPCQKKTVTHHPEKSVQQIKHEMASLGGIACNFLRERMHSNNTTVVENTNYQQINASRPSSVTSQSNNVVPKIQSSSSVTENKLSPLQFLLKPAQDTNNNPTMRPTVRNGSQCNTPVAMQSGSKLTPFEWLMIGDTKQQINLRQAQTTSTKLSDQAHSATVPQLMLIDPRLVVEGRKHQSPVESGGNTDSSSLSGNKPTSFLMKSIEDHQSTHIPTQPQVENAASKLNIPQSTGNNNKLQQFLMKPIEDTTTKPLTNISPSSDNSHIPQIPSAAKLLPYEFLLKSMENPIPPSVTSQSNTPQIQPSVTKNTPQLQFLLNTAVDMQSGGKLTPFEFLMKPIGDTKQQINDNLRPSVESASKSSNTESSVVGNKPTPLEFLLKPIREPPKKFILKPGGDGEPQSNFPRPPKKFILKPPVSKPQSNNHQPSVDHNGSASRQPIQSPSRQLIQSPTHGPNEMKFLQDFVEKMQSANKSTKQQQHPDTDELLPMDDRCSNLLRNLHHPNRNPLQQQQEATRYGSSDQVDHDETVSLGMHNYQLIPDTVNQLKLRQYMKELGIDNQPEEGSSRGTSPKPEAEFVSVYWDLENCSMISGKNAADAVKIIRDTLYKGLCEGEFMVYCDVRKEDPQVIKSLHGEGVGVVHVESSSQTVQLELKIGKRMMNFCSTQPGSLVILITGDSHYKSVIMQLKNRFKAKICLVHPSDTKRDLIDHATESWRFEALLETCPNQLYLPEVNKEVFACLVINIPLTSSPPQRSESNRIKSNLLRVFSQYNGKIRAYDPPMAIITFTQEELFKRATKRVHMEKFPVPQSNNNNTVSYPTLQVYALLPGWEDSPMGIPGFELTNVWKFVKDPTVELLAFKKRMQNFPDETRVYPHPCGNN